MIPNRSLAGVFMGSRCSRNVRIIYVRQRGPLHPVARSGLEGSTMHAHKQNRLVPEDARRAGVRGIGLGSGSRAALRRGFRPRRNGGLRAQRSSPSRKIEIARVAKTALGSHAATHAGSTPEWPKEEVKPSTTQ